MNEQEKFWSGEFGNEYIGRNCNKQIICNKTASFAEILKHTKGIKTVCEFGANIGLNLTALNRLIPDLKHTAIEINNLACERLRKVEGINKIINLPICEVDINDLGKHDLTFTSGVLIHINPEQLPIVYQKLYDASNKYILVREYFNPVPVEVVYRGHAGKLYKRDFAGEMLERFPDLELVSYGFHYNKDHNFKMDNNNWFLMQKV